MYRKGGGTRREREKERKWQREREEDTVWAKRRRVSEEPNKKVHFCCILIYLRENQTPGSPVGRGTSARKLQRGGPELQLSDISPLSTL